MVFNYLERKNQKPDPKELQINLTGFMARNAKTFVDELWQMLISAAQHPSGTAVAEEQAEEACAKTSVCHHMLMMCIM